MATRRGPAASEHEKRKEPGASDRGESDLDGPETRTKRPVGLVGVVACAALLGASWLAFKGVRRGLDEFGGLQGGKGSIAQSSECRTSLSMTTACQGENSSFQECHYHFRAEGVPDPRVCAAFLAGPDAGPAPSADDGPCPETHPAGWEGVACQDFHLDAKMVCFRCSDRSHLEAGRELLQAFDRSCDQGVVLKSCNEPLAGTAGL